MTKPYTRLDKNNAAVLLGPQVDYSAPRTRSLHVEAL